MPSGYVQRFKGKIQADRMDPGTSGIHVYTLQSSAASATAANTLQNDGLSIVVTSSGSAVFTLQAPVQGVIKHIGLSTLSSGAIIASTAATFDGTNPVLKYLSTIATAGAGLALVGLSTSRWQIVGLFPPSTTQWLLSATT